MNLIRGHARYFSGISGGRLANLYESLISEGKMRPDPRQKSVVCLMQGLADQLEAGSPAHAESKPSKTASWFSLQSWRSSTASATDDPPSRKGLYIFGGCGTGKTMLMDMFFSNVAFSPKKRVHFHEYMIDVHHRLFALQKVREKSEDLVERVASDLMKEARLLCFDEFQVTHISDAVLMRRLFSIMLARGVIVVATSNRPPDDLYRNGLNRELFVPFIPILKKYCIVHNMDSETDYRQMSNASGDMWRSYFAPLNAETAKALESKFFRIATNDIELDAASLEVQGRSVAIRRAARKSNIAWFTFSELCDKPLGSADYITLAKRFHTVFIEGIPQLTLQEINQTRRFITLIDALYDNGTRIFFSCESSTLADIFLVDAQTKTLSSLDEVFAWDRTVSRLTEMTSIEYLISHSRKLSPQQFFGQYDLDSSSLSSNEIREIFARYDKNNDSVIAVAGLNRMINDLNTFVSGGSNTDAYFAPSSLLNALTGSPTGNRIHLKNFMSFVQKNGLLATLAQN